MNPNEELLNEIMECVSKIPLEYQERILDVVKAMAYTREVIQKENEKMQDNQSA